jgi:uncharacterized protein (DUF302 family)
MLIRLSLVLWFLALAAGLAAPARAEELHARRLMTTDYALARQVLVEAIEDEGLVLSAVSDFGRMLARTDPDVGHGAGGRFRHAEVFAFCSVRVAARLVLEAAERIAYCPLTIALYQEAGDGPVRLSFRPPGGDSPGAHDGLALLERLAARVEDLLPRTPIAR